MALRVFLDANILFSAAKSDGAIRRLLFDLHASGHFLVADVYVATEARRNIAAKADAQSMDYLEALLLRIEVAKVQYAVVQDSELLWLPDKDRPVLKAAIALQCQALVTGDRTHFGAGFGKSWSGVMLYSPAQLAQAAWPAAL